MTNFLNARYVSLEETEPNLLECVSNFDANNFVGSKICFKIPLDLRCICPFIYVIGILHFY